MTFPLNEMYGYSRLCDRLRSSAIIWKRVSLRSSAIYDPRSSAIVCDHMETSLKWLWEKSRSFIYLKYCSVKSVLDTMVGPVKVRALKKP